MFRVSLANLAAAAAVAASSEDSAYPAANAASPEQPFRPWKTMAVGAQRLVVDFGAPVTLDVVALIRANFASAVIEGNATDAAWIAAVGLATGDELIVLSRALLELVE